MSAMDLAPAPKVSVMMITYNHEAYIAQAIESVLMQETTFPVELVIGEDCSTDRTREIVVQYAQRYPDHIRPLLHDHNLGLLGKNNFVATFQACRGQYIAWLDGDDYWTDKTKLQKQVTFLDSHSGCAACFHGVVEVREGSSAPPRVVVAEAGRLYTLKDLLGPPLVPACTVMFRNGLVNCLPDWFYTIYISDWPLHVLNAQYGRFGYIDDVMAVYRIHPHSVWSAGTARSRFEDTVKMREHLNSHLGFKYDRLFRRTIAGNYLQLAAICADDGDLAAARRYFHKCLLNWRLCYPFGFADIPILASRLYFPSLYRRVKALASGGKRKIA